MIHEKDLDESIARYQGEPEPSIETCRKLAACLIVKRELFGEPEHIHEPSYSYAAESPTEEPMIDYDSGTEFSAAINGRDPAEIWPIIDEMMSALQVQMPRQYNRVIQKIIG